MDLLPRDRTADVALRGALTPLWAAHYVKQKPLETANPSAIRWAGGLSALLGGLGGSYLGNHLYPGTLGKLIGGALASALAGSAGSAAAYNLTR